MTDAALQVLAEHWAEYAPAPITGAPTPQVLREWAAEVADNLPEDYEPGGNEVYDAILELTR